MQRSLFYQLCLLFVSIAASSAFSAGSEPMLSGVIRDRFGKPVRNAEICLYRADYRSSNSEKNVRFPRGASRCRKTDKEGKYRLFFPDRSTYMLIARKKNQWTARSITPPAAIDTIITSDTLRATGSLIFSIKMEDSSNRRANLFLNGTPYVFSTDSEGTFQLSHLPAGTYGATIQPHAKGYRTVICTLRVHSTEQKQINAPLLIPKESVAYVPSAPPVIGDPSPDIPPPLPPPVPDTTAETSKKPVAKPAPLRTKTDKVTKTAPPATPTTPPVVKAPADTFIGIFETLTLNGTATSGEGIASMEWDIGGTGRFIATPEGRIELPPHKTSVQRLPCIFRATDKNGLRATDTTYVWAGLLWMSISPPKELLGRNGHSFLAFNDALFIIGGNRSDVWSSSDAIHWTELTANAPFGKLFGHSTVVFNNKLWILGGKTGPRSYNRSLWSSSTGARWQNSGAIPFPKRHYHSAVVYQGKIWVIGGISNSENEPFLNDVWSSADGRSWNLVTKNAPFGERYGHSCVVFNNELWLLGGFNDAIGNATSYQDVWRSSDGATWKQVPGKAPFSGSNYHSVCIFDNRLWAVGGYSRQNGTDTFTDVLSTSDGASWTNLTSDKTSNDRFFCASVLFNKRIIVSPSDSHKLWIMR